MSYENLAGMHPVTLPATTGLPQHTFVTMNSAGLLAAATTSSPIVGVTYDGTTSSTSRSACKIYPLGSIAPVKVTAASTVAVGNRVSVSTGSAVQGGSSTNYMVGIVVAGSSGAAGRVVSVLLSNIGIVS